MTTQISDRLLLDGKEYRVLGSIPLPPTASLSGYGVQTSACHRGYVARWAFIDSNLNLTGESKAKQCSDANGEPIIKSNWVDIDPIPNHVTGRWRIAPIDAEPIPDFLSYGTRFTEEYLVTLRSGQVVKMEKSDRPEPSEPKPLNPEEMSQVKAMMEKALAPPLWRRVLRGWRKRR